jgi:hypothetical protein
MSTLTPYLPARRPARLLTLLPPPPLPPRPAPRPPPAISHLRGDCLRAACRLASLYQYIFPDETDWRSLPIPANEEESLTALETFLDRVCSHRFPVITEIWEEELAAADWRLWQIPLDLHGLDIWYDEEWDYYDEPTRMLLYLSGWTHLNEPDEADAPGRSFRQTYPDYQLPPDFNPVDLPPVLRALALPPPLDVLPDLIAMTMANTGNSWLDYTNSDLAESGNAFPEWDTWPGWYQEWRQAEPILLQTNQLTEWVKADKESRLAEIVAYLTDAHERRQRGGG